MQPLSERLRPQHIDDIIGQEQLTQTHSLFRQLLTQQPMPSFILWGPPGSGKTTLAHCMQAQSRLPFHSLSAVHCSVKHIKDLLQHYGAQPFMLFLDEIHHFNKSQQDIFLRPLELGQLVLIGATTENPSFELNKALLSRCHVLTLHTLNLQQLETLFYRAVRTDALLKEKEIQVKNLKPLLLAAQGDGRKLLTLLETLSQNDPCIIDEKSLSNLSAVAYHDARGEQHYDLISAFIKSMRGSDPNASVFYLAQMLRGGENILFIARRMIIFAAEDVGLANPNALLLANAAFDAVHKIGMPEARIILSQCAIYLACSDKSNSGYRAINDALSVCNAYAPGDLSIPVSLRNAPTALMKDLNYGKDYRYPHDASENFTSQEYMPAALSRRAFYQPGNNPKEIQIQQKMQRLWNDKYMGDPTKNK